MSCRKQASLLEVGDGERHQKWPGEAHEEENKGKDRSQKLTTISLCHMALGHTKRREIGWLFTHSHMIL